MNVLLYVCSCYSYVGCGRESDSVSGEWSAILFDTTRLYCHEQDTFWLSDTPTRAGSKSFGNRLPRICTCARFEVLEDGVGNGVEFWVYNTHLDHESANARVCGAELILSDIQKRCREKF